MARNRKRAKERRARRPQPAGSRAQPGRVTGRPEHGEQATPEPGEQATPEHDVQATPEQGEQATPEHGVQATPEHDDLATPGPIEHAAPDVELAEAQMALGRPELSGERGDALGSPDWDGSGGELAASGAHHPEPAGHAGNRLINFIQGSWRELQRVQWPDRRQVMQATGVVLGFVIVAGAYLGVADALAGKIVDFILK